MTKEEILDNNGCYVYRDVQLIKTAMDEYANQEAIELIEFIRGIRVKEYSTNEEIYELFLKEKGGKG